MYIVMRAHTKHNPVSYENLIAGKCGTVKWKNTKNFTVTKKVPTNSVNYNKKLIDNGILALRQVTKQFESEGLCPDSMYKHYQIPKKTGGMRNIDEPNEELKGWQNEIVRILKEYFGVMHHTNAYGYVEKRCCLDVAEKHRLAGSNWFLKIDISDFFGSTTLDHLVKQMGQVYPFANLIDSWHWYYEDIFRKALKICFLNGGLPQGSPASPLLTNLLMIPFDYEITKKGTIREKSVEYKYKKNSSKAKIGSKAARKKAAKHSGVSYNTVKKGTCTYEYSNKKKEGKYEVKFKTKKYKYEYEILAPNGTVMEYDKKRR